MNSKYRNYHGSWMDREDGPYGSKALRDSLIDNCIRSDFYLRRSILGQQTKVSKVHPAGRHRTVFEERNY